MSGFEVCELERSISSFRATSVNTSIPSLQDDSTKNLNNRQGSFLLKYSELVLTYEYQQRELKH